MKIEDVIIDADGSINNNEEPIGSSSSSNSECVDECESFDDDSEETMSDTSAS